MNQRLGYRPALDGLRAFSVIAVILYHAGLSWIPGGFLGVEVFFVVSGFLITALLLGEHADTGSVNLSQFWLRRARRLLPALFAMLAVVLVLSAFVHTESGPDFRRDVLPSVFYVSNWWQVYGIDEPYFAATVLPVLRHLWSLAVEEQWYLVWPIAAGWMLRRRVSIGVMSGAVAVAVMVFTALWVRESDAFRINWLYLGTVSRSSGLLVGAALAWLWFRRPSFAARGSDTIGAIGAAGIVTLFVSQHVDSMGLYRGGLAAATFGSAMLIVAAMGDGRVARAFAWRPLAEVGRRSYGLYLWHWPFFVFLDARESIGRLLVALLVTIVVNEVVFRLVETPARRADWWSSWRRFDRRVVSVSALAVVVVLVASSIAVMRTEARNVAIDTSDTDVVFEIPSTSAVATTAAPPASMAITASTTTTTAAPLPPLPRRVVIVGDSQAYALWVNRPDGIEEFFDLSDGSVQGCGVYEEGVGWANDGKYRRPFDGCSGFTKRWMRAVERNDAEIALVVLGAWELLDLKVDGMRVRVGTVTADRIFERQLRVAIDTLLFGGVAVALLEIPCFRPIESWDDPMAERSNDAGVAHLNDLMRRIATSYPSGVHFVDGPDEWCSDSPIATDLSYRYDGVHVYRPGSKLVFETIADQLLRIPARPG